MPVSRIQGPQDFDTQTLRENNPSATTYLNGGRPIDYI